MRNIGMQAYRQTRGDIDVRQGVIPGPVVPIAYEDWGDPAAPPLLLIMGLGAQMVLWPDGFCGMLAGAGLRVIRFDNRDAGLSGRCQPPRQPSAPRPPLWRLMVRAQLGLSSRVPYTLADMAADTAALLRGLGLARAHIAGASMGGMIAQILAAQHASRVSSLTVLFSSTNQPLLPPTAPGLLWKMLRSPGPKAGPEAQKAHIKDMLRALGTSEYPVPDEDLEDVAACMVRRGIDPSGVRRQLMAVLGTGDLRPYCRAITAPTLVIHGENDRMLPKAAGRAVARAIPGAQLHLIPGMGHDVPPALWPRLAGLIVDHVAAASARHDGASGPPGSG